MGSMVSDVNIADSGAEKAELAQGFMNVRPVTRLETRPGRACEGRHPWWRRHRPRGSRAPPPEPRTMGPGGPAVQLDGHVVPMKGKQRLMRGDGDDIDVAAADGQLAKGCPYGLHGEAIVMLDSGHALLGQCEHASCRRTDGDRGIVKAVDAE